MPRVRLLAPRNIQCPAGYYEYHCQKSNYNGCCSIDPCDLASGCPANKDGTPASASSAGFVTSFQAASSSSTAIDQPVLASQQTASAASAVTPTGIIAPSAGAEPTATSIVALPSNTTSTASGSGSGSIGSDVPSATSSTAVATNDGSSTFAVSHDNGALIGGLVGGITGGIILVLLGLLLWTQYKPRRSPNKSKPKAVAEMAGGSSDGPVEVLGSPVRSELAATEASERPGTGTWFAAGKRSGESSIRQVHSPELGGDIVDSPVSPVASRIGTGGSPGQTYRPYRPSPHLEAAELPGSPVSTIVTAGPVRQEYPLTPRHSRTVSAHSSTLASSLNDIPPSNLPTATPRSRDPRAHCMSWVYYEDTNGMKSSPHGPSDISARHSAPPSRIDLDAVSQAGMNNESGVERSHDEQQDETDGTRGVES